MYTARNEEIFDDDDSSDSFTIHMKSHSNLHNLKVKFLTVNDEEVDDGLWDDDDDGTFVVWVVAADFEYFESNSMMSCKRITMTTASMKMPMSMTLHRNIGKHFGSTSLLLLNLSASWRDGSIFAWSRLKFTLFFFCKKIKIYIFKCISLKIH